MALSEIIVNALKAAKVYSEALGTSTGKAFAHHFLGGGRPLELGLTDVEEAVLQGAVGAGHRLGRMPVSGISAQGANTLRQLGIEPAPNMIEFGYGHYPVGGSPDVAPTLLKENAASTMMNTYGAAFAKVHPKETTVFDLYKFYPGGAGSKYLKVDTTTGGIATDPQTGERLVREGVSIGELVSDIIKAATSGTSATPPLEYVGVKYGKPYVIYSKIDTTPEMARKAGMYGETGMQLYGSISKPGQTELGYENWLKKGE